MALMKPLTPASRRPLERGQFSWVTLVMLLGLATAGYLAWVWIPIYATHYEAKQVVRDFMNQAVKNREDALLVQRMCAKLKAVETVPSVDAAGRRSLIPVVDVQPAEVTWERDTQVTPPMLHVAFEYKREVVYPVLDRVDEVVMAIDLTQDIEIPKWK